MTPRWLPLGCLLLLASLSQSQDASISVDISRSVFETSSRFKSWNIDSSSNRGFFQRNLNDTELHYLAAASMPGYLRFGGTGNDFLVYAFGNTSCPSASSKWTCLNQTLFVNLMEFSKASGAELIFGLNIAYSRTQDGVWDSSNARELLEFAIARGYSFFGFELGNEQNKNMSPEDQAKDFQQLQLLLKELYPDATTRPKILGPDPHSFKGVPVDSNLLKYISSFMASAQSLGIELHAVTHHEYVLLAQYIEVDSELDFESKSLGMTSEIAQAVNQTVKQASSDVLVFAGEIGPHNGGSPPCDHSSMRWATFANSFWYLDAMGSKARHGYSAFCRQDFIGADYGMLDCATHTPLPDFYASILWSSLMGERILNVSTVGTSSIRAYAHCTAGTPSPLLVNYSAPKSGVSLLLLNLAKEQQTVLLPSTLASSRRYDFVMTMGNGGVDGQDIRINGHDIIYKHMALPTLSARLESGAGEVALPPQSIALLVFDTAVHACT